MKKRTMTSIVAVSLLMCASSLFGLNINKQAKVKEAKANTNHSFYVAIETDYSVKTWFNAGYSTSDLVDFTKTDIEYQGVPVYSGSVTSVEAGHFDELRVQLYDGGDYKEEKWLVSGWNDPFTHDGQIFIYNSNSWVDYSLADVYKIKCGDDNYVEMAWDEGGGLPSGVSGQFSATLDITAGQSLTIQKNTGAWGDLVVSIEGNTNNYHNGAVCVSVSQAKIYLKYLANGNYEAWVPGYTACTVVIGGNEYTTTQNGEDYDTVLVNADKNQTIKISWNHVEIGTYLNPNSTSGCFSASNGTVTCLLTGSYTFRAHKNDLGTETNTLYIVRNDTSTANYLASKFNNDVLSKCDAGGNTNQSQLKAAWDIAADHFTNQPATITNLFVDSSSDAAIARMLQWYRYIIEKYGTSVASDFLNKGYNKASSPVVMALNTSSNATSTIVVVTSLISVCALGAFFFLKKKKENN